MTKDPELWRLLLLRTEAFGVDAEAADRYHSECEKYDVPTRAYQVLLMKEEGLVEAIVSNDLATGIPNRAAIQRMTTKGHDYLDLIRNKPQSGTGERSKLT